MNKTLLTGLFYSLLAMNIFADEVETLELLKLAQSSEKNTSEAIEAGRIRASLCGYCHGVQGTSERNYIPNLAGQNLEYLIHQFQLFASGKRRQSVMEELSGSLSIQDQVNLSLYYASQIPERRFDIQGDVRKGMLAFKQSCESCHGIDGVGNKMIPKLATQPQFYLKQTLTNLKKHSGHRSVPEMESVLANITDTMITDISAYLSSITSR